MLVAFASTLRGRPKSSTSSTISWTILSETLRGLFLRVLECQDLIGEAMMTYAICFILGLAFLLYASMVVLLLIEMRLRKWKRIRLRKPSFFTCQLCGRLQRRLAFSRLTLIATEECGHLITSPGQQPVDLVLRILSMEPGETYKISKSRSGQYLLVTRE